MSGTADEGAGLAASLVDAATPDEVIAAAAARTDAEGAALILARDERWRRHPVIIERLFGNPALPMSLVNQAVDRAARAGLVVEGIPAFAELAQSIAADPEAVDPQRADAPFVAALQQAEQPPPVELAAADDPDAPADPAATPKVEDPKAEDPKAEDPKAEDPKAEEKKKRKSPIIDFTKLKLYEKIRLATLGNAYCRQTLLRDSNRLVAMAAIRSPGITETEVVRASGNRALAEEVIRYIANQKEYVKMYPVKMNLVQNPKCPLALSMRLIAHLHAEDLKTLSRSRNVPSALSTAAKKLMLAREAAK